MAAANVRLTNTGNFYINSGQFDEASYNATSGYTKNLLLNSQTFLSGWTPNLGTVIQNAILAPDGRSTAVRFNEQSTGSPTANQRIFYKPATTGGATYTFSVYLKPAERYAIRIYFEDTDPIGGGRVGQFLNLLAGTVTSTYQTGTNTLLGSKLQSLPNGWYRYSWTVKAQISSAANGTAYMIIGLGDTLTNFAYAGDGRSGIYMWGAQMELGSSVTDYVPTGSTLTPAPPAGLVTKSDTTGFYTVGSLDEVGINRSSTSPTNLIAYSQQFDQSYWLAQNITVTPNATQAPDGTMTGTLITEPTGLATHVLAQNISLPAPNATYTFSCYIKQYSRNRQFWFQFHETPAFNYVSEITNNSLATFDIAASLGGSANAQGQLYKNPIGSITPAADGWYRITLTVTIANQTANTTFNIGLYNAFGQNYVGDGTSGIYIWGSQVEIGSVATDYVPTGVNAVSTAFFVERKSSTGLHRIAGEYDEVTYNPASGYKRNLFPSTENVVVNIGQGWATTSGTSKLTPIYGVQGPDSTNNGIKLVEDPGNRDHAIQTLAYSAVGLAVPAGQPVTLSIYLKAAERSFVQLQADNIGVVPGAQFNLQTGVITATFGGAVSRIQAVGNGWYRCSFTTTPARAANINMKIILCKNAAFSDFSYPGELNNGIYIYGPQCELGSNLTTYVGTGVNAVPLN
jgi:hypothetical protein